MNECTNGFQLKTAPLPHSYEWMCGFLLEFSLSQVPQDLPCSTLVPALSMIVTALRSSWPWDLEILLVGTATSRIRSCQCGEGVV